MSGVKPRNIYLDIIKGIAITLVVFAHCIQFGSKFASDKSYFDDTTFKLIYSFHMPLFMLISGYLFYNSVQKYTFKRNLKSRIYQILSPIIVWNIIRIVFNTFIRKRYFDFDIQSDIIINAFWFLWAVFWCSLLVLIIHHFFKDNLYLYLIIGIVLQFISGENIGLYTYMYPYFVVGYLWNKYKFEVKITEIQLHKKLFLAFSCIIIFIVLFRFFKREDYIYETGTYLLRGNSEHFLHQLLINTYRYAIGFIGCSCVLILLKYIVTLSHLNQSSLITKMFTELGKRTLGIYIISSFAHGILLSLPNRANYGYGMIFIETIIILIVTYIIIRIIEYNNLIRQILLGWKV